MASTGVSDFIYKRAQDRGIVLETYLLVETLPFSALALITGALLGDLYIDRVTVLYGLLFGVISFLAIFSFVTSLHKGEAGVNTLIFRLNFVFTALLAILFLGEPPTPQKALGLLLAISAIGAVTLLQRTGRPGSPPRALAFSALAMAFFALLNLVFKIGVSKGGNVGWMIPFGAASWAGCCLVVIARRRDFRFPRNNWVFLPWTGGLKSLAFVALLYALQRGEASVVVPIAQLSFLVTVLLATFILKEPLTGSKVLGLLLAVGAILVFSR
jgi:transporter family protein